MLSIITPVYNGVQFIRENIESIEKLSFIEFEHIIVDGGSTDGTLEILKEYPTIKILHQKEKTGMYGAINMGFSIAKGDYICWINCDDRIIPKGFIEMYRYALRKNLDFVSSDGIFFYTPDNIQLKVKSTRFSKYFLKNGLFPFSQPSVIYKKKLYNDVNGLDFEKYKITGDGDLFHRMSLLKKARFGYLPVQSSIFIKHGNSLGDKNSQKANEELKQNKIRPRITLINRFLFKITRMLSI